MIYPDVPVKDWSERFKLPVKDVECKGCQKTFKQDVPVIVQGCAGFSIPVHECGEGSLVAPRPRAKTSRRGFYGLNLPRGGPHTLWQISG